MEKHTLAAMAFLCIVTTILAAAAANADDAPAPASAVAAPAPAVAEAPVTAASGKTTAAPANDRASTIARVEAYLTSITSIKARFNQVAPDGTVQTGTFYLKRPGKMRWDYDPPTPVLLVSDGKTITYYDSQMGQVNYIDVDDTLAGFLTRKDIAMDSDATKVTAFTSAADVIRITLEQNGKPGQGSLTLEFVDRPLQLKYMTIKDATGNQTRVQLQGAEYGVALADSLFVFKDPRGVTPNKR